jgi:hypothetical protein
MAEEFYKWRAEVCEVLQRLNARPSAPGELEELRREVENADYRDLPRVLMKMAALSLLEPELKRYLPSVQTAKRWMEAERERRLEVVRKYTSAAGEGKVVVNFFRWDIVTGTYEYFALAEVVRPGMSPVWQTLIGGLPAYADKASMTVVDRKELAERYGGKRLMAVVHIVEDGREEYFIEELYTEELLLSDNGGER